MEKNVLKLNKKGLPGSPEVSSAGSLAVVSGETSPEVVSAPLLAEQELVENATLIELRHEWESRAISVKHFEISKNMRMSILSFPLRDNVNSWRAIRYSVVGDKWMVSIDLRSGTEAEAYNVLKLLQVGEAVRKR